MNGESNTQIPPEYSNKPCSSSPYHRSE